MTQATDTQEKVIVTDYNFHLTGHDAEMIKNLDAEMLYYNGIKNGSTVLFQTVEVTKTIEEVAEYGYGYNGQMVEKTVSESEAVISETTMKLKKRNGKTSWIKL